jgi:hypothetical protein
MIKLYNNSKLSNEVILPILKQAYKLAEIKGKIVVVITKGVVGKGIFYNTKNLQFKPYFKSNRFIKSNAGFIVIHPNRCFSDAIDCAQRTCEIILHEFKHASDYINKIPFARNLSYRKRSHEIRARFFANYEVKIDEELLLNLAVEIERLRNKNREV